MKLSLKEIELLREAVLQFQDIKGEYRDKYDIGSSMYTSYEKDIADLELLYKKLQKEFEERYNEEK